MLFMEPIRRAPRLHWTALACPGVRRPSQGRPCPRIADSYPPLWRLLFLIPWLLIGACDYPSPRPATILATVVRIEQPQGEFFSPRMPGPSRPLTRIYLRPGSGQDRARESLLVVAVLGPYRPRILGEQGDVVSLTYPGTVLATAEIPYEDLVSYEVVRRAQKPAP